MYQRTCALSSLQLMLPDALLACVLIFLTTFLSVSGAPDTNGVVVLHSVPSFLPEQDVVSLVSC